ncbi:MAG: DUF4333 domain-containing protein [Leptolyngbyaceae cyanobacterium bins.59]|nr:DUF4333 domain-containing protein [Leptolyngbyaceae cyanobacterium bins.59]
MLKISPQFTGLLLLGFALVGCGNLDTRLLATTIQAGINGQGGIQVKAVRCPEGVKKEGGRSFECRGELEGQKSFPIVVHQRDDQGAVDWEVLNSKTVLNLKSLQLEVRRALRGPTGKEPKVNCGGFYRLNTPGDSFECQVVKEDEQEGAIAVRIDPQGNLLWNEIIDGEVAAIPPAPPDTSGATPVTVKVTETGAETGSTPAKGHAAK